MVYLVVKAAASRMKGRDFKSPLWRLFFYAPFILIEA